MLQDVLRADKTGLKNIEEGRISNTKEQYKIDNYERNCLLDMVGNVFVAEKVNLSFWRLTMFMAEAEKKGLYYPPIKLQVAQ